MISPSQSEQQALDRVWQDQSKPQGPAVDWSLAALPAAWAAPPAEPEDVAQALREALGWPEWVRLYAKPPQGVIAASRLARDRGLPGGILWMAPGCGAPFDPPRGEPGVAMLRGEWAPDAEAMTQAQAEARRRGLLLVVDEAVTFPRLAPGGATQYFGLSPDLVYCGPALAAGRPFAALAGRGQAPAQPAQAPAAEALAAVMGVLERAREMDISARCAALGRVLALGLNYFTRQAQVWEDIHWEGALQLPRMSGPRLWAFTELAKEEGLRLGPQVFPDPALGEEEARDLIWPRLARACARLRVLPEGEKAPLGWRDAAERTSCSRVNDILASLD